MSIPDYQTLMLPVLAAASHGEVGIGELVDQLGEQLGLTPEERTALLPSGRQTIFSNRVHWAKTYLGKAGLIEATRRGHFKITARGEQVFTSHPARIDNAFLGQFDEFRQFRERSANAAGISRQRALNL
jgi:restriction system protein